MKLFVTSLNIFKKNLILKYRNSLLGYFWTIFSPLSFSIILLVLNYFNLINQNSSNQDYFIYVISGLTTWSIFSDTVNINGNNFSIIKNIISKLKINLSIIFFSTLYEVLLNFFLRTVIFFTIIFIFVSDINFFSLILNLFLIFITLFFFGNLFYLIFFPLSFLFQDSVKILSPLISLIFITSSAVIYSNTNKIFEILHKYNPIAHLLEMLRHSINKENVIEFSNYSLLFAFLIIFIILTLSFYKLLKHKISILIDRGTV